MIHSRLKPCIDSDFCRKEKRLEIYLTSDLPTVPTHLDCFNTILFFGQDCVYTHSKDLVFQLFYDSRSDLFMSVLNRQKPQGS